jgi:prepilin-type N-terminal cleavage/methylation domain-containing protein
MEVKHNNQRFHRGFTLVELMAIVAIVGILAAVAIPSFRKMLNRSRSSEAPINLKAIADGAQQYYLQERLGSDGVVSPRKFPGSSSYNNRPSNAPCTGSTGSQYPKSPTVWNTPVWRDLRFSLKTAHYFRYGFRSENTGNQAFFFARAQSDLNCNGVLSSYRLRGSLSSGGLFQRSSLMVTNRGE